MVFAMGILFRAPGVSLTQGWVGGAQGSPSRKAGLVGPRGLPHARLGWWGPGVSLTQGWVVGAQGSPSRKAGLVGPRGLSLARLGWWGPEVSLWQGCGGLVISWLIFTISLYFHCVYN